MSIQICTLVIKTASEIHFLSIAIDHVHNHRKRREITEGKIPWIHPEEKSDGLWCY